MRPLPSGPRGGAAAAPGWHFIFIVNGTLSVLCAPDEDDIPPGDRLLRDSFGMHRFPWPDDSTNFYLGYGDWIRLLRSNGFTVENLVEMRAPAGAVSPYPWISAEWGRRWPTDEAWVAHRTN